ncbi:TPA_asm: N [Chrysanthemum alphacytorhabdovirus 1]|nr:TPA_asm: N [Chrysanthemum alphacytorhabdovirus 1]
MSGLAEALAARRKILEDAKKQGPKPATAEPKKTERKQGSNGALFSKVRNVTTPGKANPKEWSDNELASIPIYAVTQLSSSESVILGKQMKRLLMGTTATKDLVDIVLFLAVSMRDPSDLTKFLLKPPAAGYGAQQAISRPSAPRQDDQPKPSGSNVGEHSGGLSASERLAAQRAKKQAEDLVNDGKVGGEPPMNDGSSSDEQAAVYCFLAAFMLRTHSRQTESFLSSIDSMIERCGGWYEKADAILRSMTIDAALVTSFKMMLARREEVISTWVMWVAYNENETKMSKNNCGLMSYLAGQIFQYTGLHAAVQILAIQQVTKVPMDQLLGELNHRSTRQPLQAFYKMLQIHELVKEHPGRKTYFRYARVWDSGYFHELQSKACPDLVFLTASIVKQVSPTGAKSDPTKIYAIQDIGETKRVFLTEVAEKISSWLVRADDDDEEAGASWF